MDEPRILASVRDRTGDNNADILLCKIVIERSGLIEKLTSFAYAEDDLKPLLEIDAQSVDAILVDINMPRMNGLQFLEAARVPLAWPSRA